MITIFSIESEAQKFSEDIHTYLTENRKDYNAEKWGYQKYDNGYFHVKIPDDYKGEIPKTIIEEIPNVNFKSRVETKYYDAEDKEITDLSKIDISTATAKTILIPMK